jgi:hypothetical protein
VLDQLAYNARISRFALLYGGGTKALEKLLNFEMDEPKSLELRIADVYKDLDYYRKED